MDDVGTHPVSAASATMALRPRRRLGQVWKTRHGSGYKGLEDDMDVATRRREAQYAATRGSGILSSIDLAAAARHNMNEAHYEHKRGPNRPQVMGFRPQVMGCGAPDPTALHSILGTWHSEVKPRLAKLNVSHFVGGGGGGGAESSADYVAAMDVLEGGGDGGGPVMGRATDEGDLRTDVQPLASSTSAKRQKTGSGLYGGGFGQAPMSWDEIARVGAPPGTMSVAESESRGYTVGGGMGVGGGFFDTVKKIAHELRDPTSDTRRAIHEVSDPDSHLRKRIIAPALAGVRGGSDMEDRRDGGLDGLAAHYGSKNPLAGRPRLRDIIHGGAGSAPRTPMGPLAINWSPPTTPSPLAPSRQERAAERAAVAAAAAENVDYNASRARGEAIKNRKAAERLNPNRDWGATKTFTGPGGTSGSYKILKPTAGHFEEERRLRDAARSGAFRPAPASLDGRGTRLREAAFMRMRRLRDGLSGSGAALPASWESILATEASAPPQHRPPPPKVTYKPGTFGPAKKPHRAWVGQLRKDVNPGRLAEWERWARYDNQRRIEENEANNAQDRAEIAAERAEAARDKKYDWLDPHKNGTTAGWNKFIANPDSVVRQHVIPAAASAAAGLAGGPVAGALAYGAITAANSSLDYAHVGPRGSGAPFTGGIGSGRPVGRPRGIPASAAVKARNALTARVIRDHFMHAPPKMRLPLASMYIKKHGLMWL